MLGPRKVKRADIYITTKVTAGCGSDVSACAADPDVAVESVKTSLKNLGVDCEHVQCSSSRPHPA